MKIMPNILAPAQGLAGYTRTVQLFTFDSDSRKVLLVHERGDEESAHTREPGSKIGKKPPGFALPGGGIDKSWSEQALLGQILRHLPIFFRTDPLFLSMGMACFNKMPYNDSIELKVFLTAVKEGIEETGFLICPTQILFEEPNSPEHKVIVAHGQVITGSLRKRSIETDDCDWFALGNLPCDLYFSHLRRIIKALKVLGRDDLAAKVTVQEKPKEEKTLEAV